MIVFNTKESSITYDHKGIKYEKNYHAETVF